VDQDQKNRKTRIANLFDLIIKYFFVNNDISCFESGLFRVCKTMYDVDVVVKVVILFVLQLVKFFLIRGNSRSFFGIS